jgi:hypothetical protein
MAYTTNPLQPLSRLLKGWIEGGALHPAALPKPPHFSLGRIIIMSSISAAQLAANRANAQLARGPVTEEGKRRSSLNATRHGLTGRVVVLPSEDLNHYQAFSKELVDSLDPQTPLERQLAQTVADQQWRLNRVRSIEDGLFACGHFEEAGSIDTGDPETHAALTAARAFREDSKTFVNLTLYEQRIHRIQEKALKQLKELQAERKALEQVQLEEAIQQHKLHKMQGQPYDPRVDGFVYSTPELCFEIARREAAEIAFQSVSPSAKSTGEVAV